MSSKPARGRPRKSSAKSPPLASKADESIMAWTVRTKLMEDYSDCSGISRMKFDDKVWFKDADAVKFQQWMRKWITPAGKRKGGPPKKMEMDPTPSLIRLPRLPKVKAGLKFPDANVITEFLKNNPPPDRASTSASGTALISTVGPQLPISLLRPPPSAQPLPQTQLLKLVDVVRGVGGRANLLRCRVCPTDNHHADVPEAVKAHLMRCHLFTCGHCTAIFAFEADAWRHARSCIATRDKLYGFSEPRLPNMLAQCSFCPSQMPMAEMLLHLLDNHIDWLVYVKPGGKLNATIKLVHNGRPQAAQRLVYKYYVPNQAMAQQGDFRQCHVCGLHLPNESKLKLHLDHHIEFMYFCWLCPRQHAPGMGSVQEMVKHIMMTHVRGVGVTRVTCPSCKINMVANPIVHLLYECDYNLTCQLCRDLPIFDSKETLKEHKDKCHYDILKRFECSDCSAHFSTTADYVRHMCYPALKPTICECEQVFKSRALYNNHFINQHLTLSNRGNSCSLCHAVFKSAYEQTTHVFSHGVTQRAQEERHMLIIGYGDQSVEQRTLLTHASNASFRMRNCPPPRVSSAAHDTPSLPSDDSNDNVMIEEMPSEEEEEQQQQQQGGGALAMDGDAATETSSDLLEPSVEAVVDHIVSHMITSVTESEHQRRLEEEEAAEKHNENVAGDVPIIPEVGSDGDNDVEMIEQDETPQQKRLSARVREESAETAAVVGGQSMPGYLEEDTDDEDGVEDVEAPVDAAPVQPLIREFTPASDDDDLCVVAEVENPGTTAAAATINNQREKKFGCPKCSSRFMTGATLKDHLATAHIHDAGGSTIMEELGIPLKATLYICKTCCLAFHTTEQKKTHDDGHGRRTLECDTCGGCAYNQEVMSTHDRRVLENRIGYICAECKIEYEHDTCLHEHNSAVHNVVLFYFCKKCEVGSTEGRVVYDHLMNICPARFSHRRGAKSSWAQDQAWKRIGVCPASQLHFQPPCLEQYKQYFAQHPAAFVRPSVCNHRSLSVAMEKQVACTTCMCLENMQRHAAVYSSETGKEFDEKSIRKIRPRYPPLTDVRIKYEAWLTEKMQRERNGQRDQLVSNVRLAPPNVRVDPASGAVTSGDDISPELQQQQLQQHLDMQRAHNDIIQALKKARSGGGGGAVREPPPAMTQRQSVEIEQHVNQLMHQRLQYANRNRGGGGGGPLMRPPNILNRGRRGPYQPQATTTVPPERIAHQQPPNTLRSLLAAFEAPALAVAADEASSSASTMPLLTPAVPSSSTCTVTLPGSAQPHYPIVIDSD